MFETKQNFLLTVTTGRVAESVLQPGYGQDDRGIIVTGARHILSSILTVGTGDCSQKVKRPENDELTSCLSI
jgi:hypothetical protein